MAGYIAGVLILSRPVLALVLLLTPVRTMTVAPAASREATARLRAAVPALRKNLDEAVIGFWYPRVIDRAHGGYRVAFAADGPRPQTAPR